MNWNNAFHIQKQALRGLLKVIRYKTINFRDVSGLYTGRDGTTIKISYKDIDLAQPANGENGLNGH